MRHGNRSRRRGRLNARVHAPPAAGHHKHNRRRGRAARDRSMHPAAVCHPPPPERDPAGQCNTRPRREACAQGNFDAIFKSLRTGQAGNQPQSLLGFSSMRHGGWAFSVGVFI